jgi:hypothetical protein
MNYQDMKNDEVLAAVGTLGPGMVGKYLFERAEWIRANDPSGSLGPGMIGAYVPTEGAKADLRERGMLKEVADDAGLESVEVPSPESVMAYAGMVPKAKKEKK